MTNNWWLNERLEPSVCLFGWKRKHGKTSFHFCRRKVHLISLSYFQIYVLLRACSAFKHHQSTRPCSACPAQCTFTQHKNTRLNKPFMN